MARKSRAAMMQIEAEILNYIKKYGPTTAYQVHNALGLVLSTCQVITKGLLAEGRLDCLEKGNKKLYSIPKTVKDLPDTRTTTTPKMVSKGPKER
jgi:hypothetical protein